MANIQRPAIGQIGDLGGLYDAALDRFLAKDVLADALPPETFQSTRVDKLDVSVRRLNTFKDRLEALGVGLDLSASVLAGFVNLGRSGLVLSDHNLASKAITSLYYTLRTVEDKLNFQSPEFKQYFQLQLRANPNATHLVVGVEWGSVNVVTLYSTWSFGSVTENDKEGLHTVMTQWASFLKRRHMEKSLQDSRALHEKIKSGTAISVYSDSLPEKSILVSDIQEADEFLQIVELEIRDQNGGKGQPIAYTLLPVDTVKMFLLGEMSQAPPFQPISHEVIRACVDLFDGFQQGNQQILRHARFISDHKRFLPGQSVHEVEEKMLKLMNAQETFLREFSTTLQSIRNRRDGVDRLVFLLKDYQGQNSPNHLSQVDDFGHEVLSFLKSAVSQGAIYLGHNTPLLDKQFRKLQSEDLYVLSFSRAFIGDQVLADAQKLFWKLQQNQKPSKMVILDCDATQVPLERPTVSHYKNGQVVVHDLLAEELFNANNCIAKCEQGLETDKVEKPARRRFVKIPCPGGLCSDHESHEWKCQTCMDPLEFGFVDDYIYCQCGKSQYSNYSFKCNSSTHGPTMVPYDSNKLLRLLKSLDSSNYINILILGETGVGKSTFINALVNYLEFESLDEAMDADLNWVIPCSFSMQTMDRDNPTEQIREQKIKVGSRSDEADSNKGESATQQTAVYPVTFRNDQGTFTVRLIDTPGIGDTRGVEFDKKNMADILLTLKNYDELHGILILLKSNASRLTITFQYCVKELLTHLHHTAARNMVFGFTNTRISNYTPGDTFTPLKALLSENRDVGLSLSTHTTYCFDSESFRYLAAYKNDVIMPNKEDFDRSWEHSRVETLRLMDRFQSITPHQVKSTLSLNGTRELIKSLTKPMAEISQLIKRNIDVVADEVQDLANTRATGDQLKNKLRIKKIQMNAVTLSKPRTVCADKSCTEVRDDGSGQKLVTIYKSHCHKVCYIDNIQNDVLADPGLIDCAAFSGGNQCNECGHHWQQHLHVIYELEEETIDVDDPGVQQQIANNASSAQLKQTAIKSKQQTVREYEAELQQIHEAAAKFGIFLKKNSITPYNDATKAYLEFHIQDERGKVETVKGASKKRLESLEEDLRRHEETVSILAASMANNSNHPDLTLQAIDQAIHRLYSLKHFGKDLEKLRSEIAEAHEATNRERPHTIKRGRNPVGPPKLKHYHNKQSYGGSGYGNSNGRYSNHGGPGWGHSNHGSSGRGHSNRGGSSWDHSNYGGSSGMHSKSSSSTSQMTERPSDDSRGSSIPGASFVSNLFGSWGGGSSKHQQNFS